MAGRRHAHRPKARSSMKKADRKGAVRSKKEYEAANGVQVSEEQITHFANRITTFLSKANGRPVSRADLASKCRGKGQAAYLRALKKLISEGVVAERRTGYAMAAMAGMIRAVISRISRTYGFAKPEAGGQEIFIAGRDLKGACPGDLVLLMPTGMRDGTPEASVQTVISPAAVQIVLDAGHAGGDDA